MPLTRSETHEQHHPAVVAHAASRARDTQLRIADVVTKFAGSMTFVYIHAVLFAVWCATGLFGVDPFPFNFLTMSVSLEAIFLSTFVMIGQNRQSDFAQRKADHDFHEQEQELKANTALTRRSTPSSRRSTTKSCRRRPARRHGHRPGRTAMTSPEIRSPAKVN